MAYGLQGVRGCEVDDAEIRGNSWTVPPPFAASAVVSEVIEGVGTLHVNSVPPATTSKSPGATRNFQTWKKIRFFFLLLL